MSQSIVDQGKIIKTNKDIVSNILLSVQTELDELHKGAISELRS